MRRAQLSLLITNWNYDPFEYNPHDKTAENSSNLQGEQLDDEQVQGEECTLDEISVIGQEPRHGTPLCLSHPTRNQSFNLVGSIYHNCRSGFSATPFFPGVCARIIAATN
jgi:hypothetical protein